ncbi:transposase [Streptomyces sp. NPDC058308]|uniref:transposase n=1 Tax=Streptomyces sp. NPDC058308 TaxID=3346440 RepID=UPI0036E91ACC
MDNLSAHKGAKIRAWAKKNRVELSFTPTNASWANPIEAHFGPLRQFTLANSHHPNHTVLRAHCRHIYAGATPTPATPTPSQPNDENAPEYAARRACAGGGRPSPSQHDLQTGEPMRSQH